MLEVLVLDEKPGSGSAALMGLEDLEECADHHGACDKVCRSPEVARSQPKMARDTSGAVATDHALMSRISCGPVNTAANVLPRALHRKRCHLLTATLRHMLS